METIRIGNIETGTTSRAGATYRRHRLDLHSASGFEKSRGAQDFSALKAKKADGSESAQADDTGVDNEEPTIYRGRDGTEIELPRMSAEQRATVDELFAQVAPEKKRELEDAGIKFGAAAFNEIFQNESAALSGTYSKEFIESTTSALTSVESLTRTSGSNGQDALGNTMIAGVYGVEQNLYGFFDVLQGKQKVAEVARTDLAELNDMLANWPQNQATQKFSYNEVVFNEDGSISIKQHKNESLTKEQAKALAGKIEGDIDSLSTISNMDQAKLTMYVQKYQQTTTIMTNILANSNDTQKGIIANTKA